MLTAKRLEKLKRKQCQPTKFDNAKVEWPMSHTRCHEDDALSLVVPKVLKAIPTNV